MDALEKVEIQKIPIPTGQVLFILGVKPRTLYNYLRDFGEFFSDGSRKTKKGKRWTAEDISTIQAIRHLHAERQSIEDIRQALVDGYKPPLEGMYRTEDINRLIEAAWLLVNQAEETLQKIEVLFGQCEVCHFHANRWSDKFIDNLMKFNEFEKDLRRIKLIIGPISDSHRAMQERHDEYRLLHKEIRYYFLAEEVDRDRRTAEVAKMQEERDHLPGWIKNISEKITKMR